MELEVGDRTVRISNPDRVYFPATGATKLDLAQYYLAVGDGIVRALRERPCMMHRFPEGVSGEKVHQKRLPRGAPPWVETVQVYFPRYKPARRRTVRHRAGQRDLGGADVDRGVPPVELPPGRHREARRVADRPGPDAGLRVRHASGGSRTSRTRCSTSSAPSAGRRPPAARACTSTCGSSRAGASPTSAAPPWPSPARWSAGRRTTSPPRGGARTATRRTLFVDYNQNARDHTIASAYSVRGVPEATVSTPIRVGRDRRRRCPATSPSPPCRPGSPSWATCTPASTTRCSPRHRCWSGPSATSARARPTRVDPADVRPGARLSPASAGRDAAHPGGSDLSRG